jgi:hypothetical protein
MDDHDEKVMSEKFPTSQALQRLWPVTIFWFAIATSDLLQRFSYSATDNSNPNALAVDLEINPVVRLSDDLYQQYRLKLSERKTDTEPESVADSATMETAGNSWQDAGVLQLIDHNYRLLATFASDKRFAVLSRYHKDSGLADLVEVRVGDSLEGFVIDKIMGHKIIAFDADRTRAELALFTRIDEKIKVLETN